MVSQLASWSVSQLIVSMLVGLSVGRLLGWVFGLWASQSVGWLVACGVLEVGWSVCWLFCLLVLLWFAVLSVDRFLGWLVSGTVGQ